jgi:hypothetical protein
MFNSFLNRQARHDSQEKGYKKLSRFALVPVIFSFFKYKSNPKLGVGQVAHVSMNKIPIYAPSHARILHPISRFQ